MALSTLIDLHQGDLHSSTAIYRYHLPMTVPAGDTFERFLALVDRGADTIAEVLAILTDPSAYPCVIHGGIDPDRTTVLRTLILGVLGVPDRSAAAPATEFLRRFHARHGSFGDYADSLGVATAVPYLRAALLTG